MRRAPKHIRVLIAACILLLAIVAVVVATRRPPFTHSASAQIDSSELVELSGMVPASAERQFWGHNDSGHPPVLFRFNGQGHVLQRVRLSGAHNLDWEGMTADGRGNFFVADFGDNFRLRGAYTIYQFTEPERDAESVSAFRTHRFVYPDKQSRNCEAIFAMQGRLYLLSKESSSDIPPTIFRVEGFDASARQPDGGDVEPGPHNRTTNSKSDLLRVIEIGTLEIPGVVTDAVWSPQLRELAVLTYGGVFVYSVEHEQDLRTSPQQHIAGYFGIAEALCYDGGDLIVTNESGTIWRMSTRQP